MSLLFDTPLIAGLRYADNVIGKTGQEQLLQQLQSLELSPFRFQRWTGNRKTHSFGWRYDFEDSSFTPAQPIPDCLTGALTKAAGFAGLERDDFVQALVARYDPGAGIGWHRDRDVFENVVGISLLTPATLRFRQRRGSSFSRANLELAPGSAYLLSGEARWDWEHRITPGETLRFSITFRTFSAKGRRIAQPC